MPRFVVVSDRRGRGGVPAARGPHRRPPRRAVPGHGGRRAPPVPGHPQRRPRGRGGPRRGPAAGAGARAGPAPVRPAGAAGGRRHHQRRACSTCCSRELDVDPARRRARCPGCSTCPRCGSSTSVDRPTSRTRRSCRRPTRVRRGRDAQAACSPRCARATCCVHHPYDSFATSVQRFIEQAAADPHVLAIKQTLYRTSGDSPIVDALIDAAEAGKQVVVLVEIKARFDEQANIRWARRWSGPAATSSTAWSGSRRTARPRWWSARRADRSAATATSAPATTTPRPPGSTRTSACSPPTRTIGADLTDLFNVLTGYSRQTEYRRAAGRAARHPPRHRRADRAGDRARRGPAGRRWIQIKINSLVDEEIIDALYRASQAGVAGRPGGARHSARSGPACPGCPRTSRVRSILGRFLEHSPDLLLRRTTASRSTGSAGRPDAPQPRPPGRGPGAGDRPSRPRAPAATRSTSPSPTTWPPGSCGRTTCGPATPDAGQAVAGLPGGADASARQPRRVTGDAHRSRLAAIVWRRRSRRRIECRARAPAPLRRLVVAQGQAARRRAAAGRRRARGRRGDRRAPGRRPAAAHPALRARPGPQVRRLLGDDAGGRDVRGHRRGRLAALGHAGARGRRR